MDGSLLRKFDQLVTLKGYENRSEAIRDFVREAIVQQSYKDSDQMIAGSFTVAPVKQV